MDPFTKLGPLQDLPTCNGWQFWHYRDRGRLRVIDELRTAYRRSVKPPLE